jgi:hypothetical protein
MPHGINYSKIFAQNQREVSLRTSLNESNFSGFVHLCSRELWDVDVEQSNQRIQECLKSSIDFKSEKFLVNLIDLFSKTLKKMRRCLAFLLSFIGIYGRED